MYRQPSLPLTTQLEMCILTHPYPFLEDQIFAAVHTLEINQGLLVHPDQGRGTSQEFKKINT